MELEIVKLVLPAVLGALGAWLTARREHENQLSKLESEHRLALRQKESEILRGLEAGYAKDLRDKRAAAYRRLWKLLEPLALFHPKADVTYGDLAELGVKMREWYFSIGGLLLSSDARDAYFATQDALTEALRGAEQHGTRNQILRHQSAMLTVGEFGEREKQATVWEPGKDPLSDYLHVRKRTSALRSTLCDDLGSRARPLVAWSTT